MESYNLPTRLIWNQSYVFDLVQVVLGKEMSKYEWFYQIAHIQTPFVISDMVAFDKEHEPKFYPFFFGL